MGGMDLGVVGGRPLMGPFFPPWSLSDIGTISTATQQPQAPP